MKNRSIITNDLRRGAANDVLPHIAVKYGSSLIDTLVIRNPDAAMLLDGHIGGPASYTVICANEAMTRLTGYAAADLTAQWCPLVGELFARPTCVEAACGAVATNTPCILSATAHAKDGSVLNLSLKLIPLIGAGSDEPHLAVELRTDVANRQSDQDGPSVASADGMRSFTWHATVRDVACGHEWNIAADDPTGTLKWLKIVAVPDEPFFESYNRAILHDDQFEMDARCISALREGASGYRQRYRLRLSTGEHQWIQEEVAVARPLPGTYELIGVCREASAPQIADEGDGWALQREMGHALGSARCMVWRSIVTDVEGVLHWRTFIDESVGARRWLPIEVRDGEPFYGAFYRAIHPDDLGRMKIISDAAIYGNETHYSQEYRILTASGDYRWLAEDAQLEQIAHHRWRLVGVVTDISDKKRVEQTLAEERNLLRTIIDNIPDGVFFRDMSNRIIMNSSYRAQMTGDAAPEKIDGTSDHDLYASVVAARSRREELQVVETGVPLINIEEPRTLPNGRRVWFSASKVPLRDSGGKVIGVVGISRDITAQKQLEAERERLLADAIDRADRDALTGLWNHRAFHKRLKDEADLARARGTSVAVILVDLENFRFFNDCYGHTVGDEVLCNVAIALRTACGSNGMVARFGGDEFSIVVPLAANSDAARALRIVSALDGMAYRPSGQGSVVPIRLSYGLAMFPGEAESWRDALALADARLIRMKNGVGEAGELAEQVSAEVLATGKGFEMLAALVNSVDNKDRYTRRHSEDVLLYAYQIAREIGLSESECRDIKIAALVHDVGKIGVADSILRKPSSLSVAEFEAIKLHPTMGAIIVGAVPGFESVLPAVKHHHERWDGHGYPDGLQGAECALMARILAVADAFSAMTTDRPYRKGMSDDTALRILREGAGTQWDPEIVDAFLRARNANFAI